VRRLLAAIVFLSWLAAGPALAIDIRPVTTPLGIKAWLVQDRSVPIVTLSFSFADGAASEPESQKGVTSLMAELLTDGAGSLGPLAFKRRADDINASMGFTAGADRLGGSLSMLTANRSEAFELLRLCMTEPRFEPEMLEQRRAQYVASLNQAEQRPGSVAARTLAAAVFAGHPYAIETQGLRDSLKGLTVADVRKRATSLLDRTGLIVSAVGDISEADLAREIDRTFGALPTGGPRASLPEWSPSTKARQIVVERPVPQSTVQMAMPGISRQDRDWYPAFIMNHVLGGGGQQSRLFTEVREKRGLAYGVSSSLRTYRKASLLVITTASANEKVAETLRVIHAEIGRLASEGITEQELADAKSYLTGALPVSLDSSSSVAGLLHSMQVDGLAPDQLELRPKQIAAVTLEDVRRVARRLLREDLMTTVVVGKPVGLRTDPQ
jgi:zinc protease